MTALLDDLVPGNYRLGEAVMKMAFGVTMEQRLEPVERLLKSERTQSVLRRVTGFLRK